MKKKWYVVIGIILLIVLVLFLLKPKPNPNYQADVLENVTASSVNLDNFDELWPADGSMDDVIYRLEVQGKSWIITDGTAVEFDGKIFPEADENADLIYAFKQYNGFPTVDLLSDEYSAETKDLAFAHIPAIFRSFIPFESSVQNPPIIGIHEAFHYYVQTEENGWNIGTGDAGRETLLPAQAQPRYLRGMLVDILMKAWLEPENRDKHLSDAKIVFDTYNTDYADEAKNIYVTDILEGTADYIGYAFVGRALAGWDSPKEVIDQVTKELVLAEKSNGGVGPGNEAYDIGLYAGLVLEQIREDDEWKIEAKTVPLAEILLRDVTPAKTLPAVPESIKNEVDGTIDFYNQAYTPLAQELMNPGEDFVAITEADILGSANYGFFAKTKDTPEGMYMAFNFNGIVPIGDEAPNIKGDIIITAKMLDTPCGDEVFLMTKKQFLENGISLDGMESHQLEDGSTLTCIK